MPKQKRCRVGKATARVTRGFASDDFVSWMRGGFHRKEDAPPGSLVMVGLPRTRRRNAKRVFDRLGEVGWIRVGGRNKKQFREERRYECREKFYKSAIDIE
jgi:hypothetical protein